MKNAAYSENKTADIRDHSSSLPLRLLFYIYSHYLDSTEDTTVEEERPSVELSRKSALQLIHTE